MKRGICLLVATFIIVLLAAQSSAVVLGVNYYHESMMGKWGGAYIPRSLAQVGSDLDNIKTIADRVKLFMNPFISGNLDWVIKIADVADDKGFRIVVTMMVDDRQLEWSNWDDYSNRVTSACRALNGKVDEILVGNEITLHSSMSDQEIHDKVVALMERCDDVFSGPVSYQEFWYARDVWKNYPDRIYFMFYESLDSFRTNVVELNRTFGTKGAIGEFGEDLFDEGAGKDETWQKEQLARRWKIIQGTKAPIAYIFAYKEPSFSGFGIVRPDGTKRPSWSVFKPTTTGTSPPPTSENTKLSSMSAKCTYSGSTSCTKKSDVTDSACRYVVYGTPKGDIKYSACLKSTGIEIYRNSYPSSLTFKACFDNSCVTELQGFVKYASTTLTDVDQTDETVTISSLTRSCKLDSVNCSVKSDITDGVCRNVVFGTPKGDLKVYACDKGNGFGEIYLKQAPSSGTYKACLGAGCINNMNGFDRFSLGIAGSIESGSAG